MSRRSGSDGFCSSTEIESVNIVSDTYVLVFSLRAEGSYLHVRQPVLDFVWALRIVPCLPCVSLYKYRYNGSNRSRLFCI